MTTLDLIERLRVAADELSAGQMSGDDADRLELALSDAELATEDELRDVQDDRDRLENRLEDLRAELETLADEVRAGASNLTLVVGESTDKATADDVRAEVKRLNETAGRADKAAERWVQS